VTAQALNKRAGLELSLVPYPNINTALQDTITGRVELGVFSISIAEALIRDGKLRPLAIASSKRSGSMPEVPTLSESIKDFDFSGWFMLLAPTGTPDDIINKLSKDVADAMGDEKIREMAPKLGFEIETGSPDAARQFLAAQLELWKGITMELGLKPQ
jgi:tripartite-type tricarboxylate transporter receptor subunit TctC